MGEDLVKVGFVGAGAMAREHARAFRDVLGVVLAGVCSRTRSRAEALAAEQGVAAVFPSVTAMYETTRADLVVVAVPELAARDVSTECFGFPWAVLLEKPPGRDLAEAEGIARAAHAAGRRVPVALNRRCYSTTRAALAELDRDPGRRFAHIQDQQDLVDARALGQPEAVIRRWMFANSIHLVDYLLLFGRGTLERVSPFSSRDANGEGVVLARLRFSSGDLGLYEGLWGAPGPWAVSVTTPSRRWELRPLEAATVQRRGSRERRPVPADVWDQEFKPGVRRQAAEAVAAVRGRPSVVPTLEIALVTMRAIAAIYRTEPTETPA